MCNRMMVLKIPPHLAYVALMSAKQAINDKLQGRVSLVTCFADINDINVSQGIVL